MAKHRTLGRLEHTVYDSMAEFKESNPDGQVNLDWKSGQEGDWVLADDGSGQQVLKRGIAGNKSYIRTPPGTFMIKDNVRLDNEFRENAYNFSGKILKGERLSKRERMFVALISLSILTENYRDPVKTYLGIFPTTKEVVARAKVKALIVKEKIVTAIKNTINAAGEETGANLEWAMNTIKKTVDASASDAIKIRGAGMIADLHTKEKEIPDQMAGAFKGFTELPESEQKQLAEPPEEEQKELAE